MALVHHTIPNLWGGVTKQNESARLENQVSEMINCYPTVQSGVTKRPPTVSEIDDIATESTDKIHLISKREDEKYLIGIKNSGSVYGYNLITGNPLTITNNVPLYLASTDANSNIKATSIIDTTILANASKTINSLSDITTFTSSAYLYFKRAIFDVTNYSIAVGGYSLKVSLQGNLDKGSVHGEAPIEEIVDMIYQCMEGGYTSLIVSTSSTNSFSSFKYGNTTYYGRRDGTTAPLSVAKVGSTIKVNTADLVTVADGFGDSAVKVFTNGKVVDGVVTGGVNKIQDLPLQFFNDDIIPVNGEDGISADNYYVRFIDNNWQETKFPGQEYKLDPATMPVKLVRTAVDTFVISTIEWEDRLIGDLDSIGFPSFVGSTIDDVFFFKSRLGFVSQDNILLSGANDFYNFFPQTATDVLDDDTIDIAIASSGMSTIKQTVPFNDQLLLFTDEQQYTLYGTPMSPKTVSITQTTKFSADTATSPIALGPNVYFPTIKSEGSLNIREYYLKPETSTNDAMDITLQIPEYLPSTIKRLTGSNVEDILFVLSEDDDTSLYVYKFLYDGQQKVQSAWFKWDMNASILDIFCLNEKLYLIINRAGVIMLESINLTIKDYASYLDRGTETYQMYVELSTWIPRDNNVNNNRVRTQVRNVKFDCEGHMTINVTNGRRTAKSWTINTDTSVASQAIANTSIPVMGKAQDVKIEIESQQQFNSKIYSLSYEANITTRTKGV